MKRTAAIVILAIIAFVAGLVAVVDVMRYMSWFFSPLNFIGGSLFGAIMSGIVAIIWFGAAGQIWNLNPQGWLFMVVIATFYLILDVMSLIAGTPVDLLLPSIVISALALILGLLPSTKREFGAATE